MDSTIGKCLVLLLQLVLVLCVIIPISLNFALTFGIVYALDRDGLSLWLERIINTSILLLMLFGLPLFLHMIYAGYILARHQSPMTLEAIGSLESKNHESKYVDEEKTSSIRAFEDSSAWNKQYLWTRTYFPWLCFDRPSRSPIILLILGILQVISFILQTVIASLSWSEYVFSSNQQYFIPLITVAATCGFSSTLITIYLNSKVPLPPNVTDS